MDKLPRCYKSFTKKELKRQLLAQMNQNIMIVTENYNLNQDNNKIVDYIEHLERHIEQYQEEIQILQEKLEDKEEKEV